MTTTFLEAGTDATQDLKFFGVNVFTGGTGTVASDAGQAHTGLRAVKAVAAANGDEASFGTPDNTLGSSACISFWVYISALPAGITSLVTLYGNAATLSIFMVGINSSGTLRLNGQGATPGSSFGKNGATVLSVNTWYRVSLSYNLVSTSNYTAKLFLNGNLQTTLSNTDSNLNSINTKIALFGIDTDIYGTAFAMTAWFDDIFCDNRSDLSDCGDVRVTAKRPNANGTTNGFTTQIGAGGSGYGTGHSPQVNERPLSNTNGWSMIGAGSAITEEYNIENKSTGDVDISTATIVDWLGWADMKSLAGETVQIILAGANNAQAITSTETLYTKIKGSTTYPPGTGADIGIITDTSLTTVSLFECGIIIAYTPASAGTTTTNHNSLMLLGVGT